MRYLFIILFCLVNLASCIENKKIEFDLETYVKVTADLEIMKQVLRKSKDQEKDSVEQAIRKQIESIHNIDLDEYEMQLSQIRKDKKEYESLLDSSFKYLKRQELEVYKKK